VTYTSTIDPAKLRAIDVHVHVHKDADGHLGTPAVLSDAASRHFKTSAERMTVDETAEYYRERELAAVVFTVDAWTKLGHRPNSNEEIAVGAARNSDVLIPFGSVDPNRPDAVERVRRLADDYGVRGWKFHPTVQDFDPSDERHFPLFGTLQDLGLPAIFHTGQTGIGAHLPGGYGFRLALSNPMLLDAVAAAFPHLTIIMAHPSVPWQDEAIAVATHKANVFIDLSGWSPKYFPSQLVRQANTQLQDKVMFGSDFPLLTPERWFSDFENLDIKESVRPKILKENAVKVLGLGTENARHAAGDSNA
jgi:predicted TIM-barrel fold metal-dependent hydrolase